MGLANKNHHVPVGFSSWGKNFLPATLQRKANAFLKL